MCNRENEMLVKTRIGVTVCILRKVAYFTSKKNIHFWDQPGGAAAEFAHSTLVA